MGKNVKEQAHEDKVALILYVNLFDENQNVIGTMEPEWTKLAKQQGMIDQGEQKPPLALLQEKAGAGRCEFKIDVRGKFKIESNEAAKTQFSGDVNKALV